MEKSSCLQVDAWAIVGVYRHENADHEAHELET
jgi:hypothetical protein